MSGANTPAPFLDTRFDERGGSISPDGRMIAYESNETGRYEVYVRPFPAKEPAHQVSRDGGRAVRWRGDSREIFFLSRDSFMMAAGIEPNCGEAVGEPVKLFATQLQALFHPYAVDGDGRRFLIPISVAPEPLRVVLDWRGMIAK